jgi:hypothetical protein
MMPVRFQAITRSPGSACRRCTPGNTSFDAILICSLKRPIAQSPFPKGAIRPGGLVLALLEIGVKSWCAGL